MADIRVSRLRKVRTPRFTPLLATTSAVARTGGIQMRRWRSCRPCVVSAARGLLDCAEIQDGASFSNDDRLPSIPLLDCP